jgi:hypothetical protein
MYVRASEQAPETTLQPILFFRISLHIIIDKFYFKYGGEASNYQIQRTI